MRRLAILDVAGGQQPIFNERGDVATLFNGEIYNFRELRHFCEAKGHRFRTSTDTEILVHLYEEMGVDFVRLLDGMFAFVIWDSKRREALLARDRFGIKPLHLASTRDGLAFASETKALASAGWLRPEIDPTALTPYVRFGWVPDHLSMWRGVRRLAPGHFLTVRNGIEQQPIRYHTHRISTSRPVSVNEVDRNIDRLLDAAVERQLVADVPVGLFLSGGLDSSLLAESMARHAHHLPCHTIEFEPHDVRDLGESDVRYARLLADELGLNLHVHRVQPDATDLLPRLMKSLDEPTGDPAVINAYVIAKAAAPTTKVLLTGMGADEIAAGYRRHVAARWSRPLYQLPQCTRPLLTRLAHAGASALQFPGASQRPFLRRARKALKRLPLDPRDTGEAFAVWLDADFIARLGLTDEWLGAERTHTGTESDDQLDPVNSCMAFDLSTYLPSHNLFYTDKATMAASVEVRVPYLDNALAAYLMALPVHYKVRGRITKVALRRAAARRLPEAIVTRAKTGFGAPIRSWLHGALKPMVEELLSPEAVASRGLLDPAGVAHLLDLFRKNALDLAYPVWSLLALEIWCREVVDIARPSADDAR